MYAVPLITFVAEIVFLNREPHQMLPSDSIQNNSLELECTLSCRSSASRRFTETDGGKLPSIHPMFASGVH